MKSRLDKLPHSRVKLTVTVPAERLKEHYERAVEHLAQRVEIKGFRPGRAPRHSVIERVGNSAVLNELLETVIPVSYYQAVAEHEGLTPVEPPKVEVTALKGVTESEPIPSELNYTATVDVMPTVSVGNYSKLKIKPKTANLTLTPAELDKELELFRQAAGPNWQAGATPEAQTELRQALEANLKQQRLIEAESQTLDTLLEALLKISKVEVPEAFIHNELHRMERQVELQAKASGLTFESWLKQIKKSRDELHQEWRPQATKAAKVGLILGKIAEQEGIDPTQDSASRQVLERLKAQIIK